MLRFIGRWLRRLVFVFGIMSLISVVGCVALVLSLRPDREHHALPKAFVLTVDAGQALSSAPTDPFLTELLGDTQQLDLYSTLQGLNHAAGDDRVKAVLLDVTDLAFDPTTVQEIGAKLTALRKAGKLVVAFAETFSEGENSLLKYLAASYADEIWMQPHGMLALLGAGVEVPFFKDALANAGLRADFARRDEDKTAFNMVTESGFTPAHRRKIIKLIQGYMDLIEPQVQKNRPDTAGLPGLLSKGTFLGEEAVTAKLVDSLGYINDLEEKLMSLVGGDEESAPAEDWRVSLAEYHAAVVAEKHSLLKDIKKKDKEQARIALVYLNGEIIRDANVPTGSDNSVINAPDFQELFRELADDEAVKAVVLRINSPGGGFTPSDTLRAAIAVLRDSKPVVVSLGDVAASGGYMLAIGGDTIISAPTTIVGSIGVLGGKIVAQGLVEKLKITTDRVGVGALAYMWSPLTPFSEGERQEFNRQIDASYGAFKGLVAEARELDANQIAAVAGGKVFFGQEALDRRLVDKVGGLEDALAEARQAAGLKDTDTAPVALYPRPRLPWIAFLEQRFGQTIQARVLAWLGLSPRMALQARATLPKIH
ncbi:MAG: signal peptide peptidase SppA [Holosporales bacterium]|jgi:protease-4